TRRGVRVHGTFFRSLLGSASDERDRTGAPSPGDDREAPRSGRTIDLEVATIDREHGADLLALGDAYERSVSQVHRPVTVLSHQLPHAGYVRQVEGCQEHRSRLQHVPERVLRFGGVPQE